MHGVLDSDLKSLEEMPLNSFHRKLAIYAAGGPFLDGYILSILGVALIQATPQLKLNSYWEGMIGASALIGIFLGGFAGGWLADKHNDWRRGLYFENNPDLEAVPILSRQRNFTGFVTRSRKDPVKQQRWLHHPALGRASA
jgi:MFS family permease